MIGAYFEDLESRLERILDRRAGRVNPRQIYAYETARLGRRLFSGQEKLAWCGLLVPFDLLSAMGLVSCFVEFVGAELAMTDRVGPLLSAAEAAGYGSDTCGFHRAVLGASLEGLMPVPDFLIGTTGPCIGGLAVLENLATTFNRDFFLIEIPQTDSPEAVRFLTRQLEAMVDFVTAHTGQPLDRERLRESLTLTNQARELMLDVYDLAKGVPSPASGADLTNFGFVLPLMFGTQAAVRIAGAFRDHYRARKIAGTSGVPGERLRLMWLQNRIQFKEPLVRMLENEYRAAIVVDELNDIQWEPIDLEDPLPGLARRMISIPFTRAAEQRVAHLRRLAEAYRVDGVINPCHWGCRQGTGARGLVTEGLKQIGVPVLNLEVDCADPRNFAEGQLKTRLEAFVEMLTSRPRPW